jgi:hypothetical protein
MQYCRKFQNSLIITNTKNQEMKKTLITGLIAFCFVTISVAQDYNTGIGLKGRTVYRTYG